MRKLHRPQRSQAFTNPRVAEILLADRRLSIVWLFVRLYLGWQWLLAGWQKLAGASSVGWIRDGRARGVPMHHGDTLLAFWRAAVAPTKGGVPQVAYPWYRDFPLFLVQHHAQRWFASLIAGGEFAVGLCLVLGAFTAVAATGGAILNFNYMLAGSASLNPVLFAGEGLLILAWKSAGYIGLDRWLLPLLGTPWQPGWFLQRRRANGVTVEPLPMVVSRHTRRHPYVRGGRPHRRRQPA